MVDADELRQDVALANRIAHQQGLVSAFGHISARLGDSDRFLIPTRSSPALADARRLLVMDTDGSLLEGDGEPNTEFWIHARIYAARADVGAVAHVHAPACVTLGQIGQSLLVLHNAGASFADGVPLFARVGLIRSRELGDQVAARLGQGRAMLLRGHGANLADRDVRSVAVLACFLEEAAALQLRALAAVCGDTSRLTPYSAEEAAHVRGQNQAPRPMRRAWEYYSSLVQH
jgi:L-ribulose-5-phosphate 4-epimerase